MPPIDYLPTLRNDGGNTEATPVVVFHPDGTPAAIASDPYFLAYAAQGIAADTYALLVDLSDTAQFPHTLTGSVDLYSTFLFIDKPNNTTGVTRLGVITRIDGTDADIEFVQGISFTNQSDRLLQRDRVLTHPIHLAQSGGVLTKAATLFRATNVAAVNTGTLLPTVYGNAAPDVGDVVALFGHTGGGVYTASVSIQYAGVA